MRAGYGLLCVWNGAGIKLGGGRMPNRDLSQDSGVRRVPRISVGAGCARAGGWAYEGREPAGRVSAEEEVSEDGCWREGNWRVKFDGEYGDASEE